VDAAGAVLLESSAVAFRTGVVHASNMVVWAFPCRSSFPTLAIESSVVFCLFLFHDSFFLMVISFQLLPCMSPVVKDIR
jgi:hypothetical protein